MLKNNFCYKVLLTMIVTGQLSCAGTRPDKYFPHSLPSLHHPSFSRTISGFSGMPMQDGNKITVLETGRETFQTLYKILNGAEKSINIEIYIFSGDETAQKTAEILIKKAREGVKVNLLVDYVGGRFLNKKTIREFKKAGIKFYFFEPFNMFHLKRFNERTHRKLIIVDGKTGITGGFGISDFWVKGGEFGENVKDLQVLVEGPVVNQMQSIFQQNWYKTTQRVLIGDDYFPELPDCGNYKCNMVSSIPRNGSSALKHTYLLAINSANDYFWIENSYFIPGEEASDSLINAAKRGVDVRIIVPAVDTTDSPETVYAGRRYYERLLEAGVNICEYNERILHLKIALADDIWATIGSTNFDNRSFALSLEANLNVYNHNFSLRMKKLFLEDYEKCTLLDPVAFKKRGFFPRLREKFYGLFESQL